MNIFLLAVFTFLIFLSPRDAKAFVLYWKDGRTQNIKAIKVKGESVECREPERGLWFETDKSAIDLEKTIASKKQEEDEKAEEVVYREKAGEDIWFKNQDQYSLIKQWVDGKEKRFIKENLPDLGLKKGEQVKLLKAAESKADIVFRSGHRLYKKIIKEEFLLTEVQFKDFIAQEEKKKYEEKKALYKEEAGDFVWNNNQENYELIMQWVDAEKYLRVIADDAANGLKKGEKVVESQTKDSPVEENIKIISLTENGRLISFLYNAALIKTEEEYQKILEEERKAEEEKKIYRKKAGEKIWKANEGELNRIKSWYDCNNYMRLKTRNGSMKEGAKIKVLNENEDFFEIIYITDKKKIIKQKIQKEMLESENDYQDNLKKKAEEARVEAERKKQEIERQKAEAILNEPGPQPMSSAWNGVAYAVDHFFESALKDYDSLKIVECSPLIKSKGGWLQRIKYRAKNSFGAYNLEQKVFLIKNETVVSVVEY